MRSDSSPDPEATLAQRVLAFLNRRDYRPSTQRELLHRMQVAPADRPAVREEIRRLVHSGRVRRMRGGRLLPVPEAREVRGRVARHGRGLARIEPEGRGEGILVAARHLGAARSGDRVSARVVARGRDGRLRGVVTAVLGSPSGEMLGVFRESEHGGRVVPFDPLQGRAIVVPAVFRGGAQELHAVRFELVAGREAHGRREARVLESLGHLDEPGTDVRVVARTRNLAGEFPAEVLRQAGELPQRIRPLDAAGRERFDDPDPVTIDGETARDFDDAIAVQALSRGAFRLFVHIADVAHFVSPASAIDVEARRRGTSVYFPGEVIPMLPERLSNDLCSLRPRVERLVQSVVIELSAAGKVRQARFADGIIRSAARLTYTQVAALLDGADGVRGIPADVAPMLRIADRLREALERRRHARGSIDLDLPEPQILLDVEGAMTGVTIEPRNRAHRMIEEFMLLANEVVAGWLAERQAPCLYRVHPPPDPAKLETLAGFVSGLGLDFPLRGTPEPADIQSLLERLEGRPEYRIVGQVALQAMQQARYSPDNTGHFGLGAPVYCHFTSPIRRYPDLVVHRQLRGQRLGADQPLAGTELAAVACASSELERNAEAAEREVLAWKKVAFVDDRVGQVFDGVVTGVARFGLFVQLVDNLVEGLIRVERLGDEWFEHDAARLQLRGATSGRIFRLGDRLRVRIEQVDRVLRRVDLLPVDAAGREGRRRRS